MADIEKKLKRRILYLRYIDYYKFYYQYRTRVLGISRKKQPDTKTKEKKPDTKPIEKKLKEDTKPTEKKLKEDMKQPKAQKVQRPLPLKIEAGHFELSFD
jgi:hypothetical protein